MHTPKEKLDHGTPDIVSVHGIPEIPNRIGIILKPLTPEQKKEIEGDFKKIWSLYFGVMGTLGLLYLAYQYINH